MAYGIDALTSDCYPGTAVLINKLDIRNDAELSAVEAEIVAAQAALWILAPRMDSFDFAHYRAIHAYLFGHLYDWAGQVRMVNLSKKGTQFCTAPLIEERAALIFDRLKSRNFLRGLPHEAFVEELTDLYCSTNELHPFREGNGRTQRVFLSHLADQAGYSLSFSDIDGDLLMLATIQSAQGVTDLLIKLFMEAIIMQKVAIANVLYTSTDETFYVQNSIFESAEKYQANTLQQVISKLEADGWRLCGKVHRADETLVDMMTDGDQHYLALWMD